MNYLSGWQERLADEGKFTAETVNQILAVHGGRGRRAIEGVGERRVKQYRDFTVVVGHHDEYIVEGGTCTCEDTRYNLDADDPDDQCWHQLAVLIAESLDAVEEHDLWYSEVRDFL